MPTMGDWTVGPMLMAAEVERERKKEAAIKDAALHLRAMLMVKEEKEERIRHEMAMGKLKEKRAAFQKECPHTKSTFHVGDSYPGSGYSECYFCGKQW